MIGRLKGLLARFQQSAVGRFFAKWSEDNGPTLAITLAYFALFSLFPLLLSLTAVVGFLVRDQQTLGAVQVAIASAFPGDLGHEISAALLAARDNAGTLTVVGL